MTEDEHTFGLSNEEIVEAKVPQVGSLEKILETLQMFAEKSMETLDEADLKIGASANFLLAAHSTFIHLMQDRFGKLSENAIRQAINSLFLLGCVSVLHPEVVEEVRATLAEKYGTVQKEDLDKVSAQDIDPSDLAQKIAKALGINVKVISSVEDLKKAIDEEVNKRNPPDLGGNIHAN